MVKQRFKNPFDSPTPSALPPTFPGDGIYGKPPSPTVFNPFTDRNINFGPIRYEVDIVDDSCNLGMQVVTRFLFIRLPAISIIYRNPSCKVPLPPPPLMQKSYEEIPHIPSPSSSYGFYILSPEYDLGEYIDNRGIGYYFDGSFSNIEDGKRGSAYEDVEQIIETSKIEWNNGEILGNYKGLDYRLKIIIRSKRTLILSFPSIADNSLHSNQIPQYLQEKYGDKGVPFSISGQGIQAIATISQECIVTCYYSVAHASDQFPFAAEFSPDNFFSNGQIPGPRLWGGRFGNEDEYPSNYKNNFYKTEENIQSYTRDNKGFPVNIKSRFKPRQAIITGEDFDFYGKYYTVEYSNIRARSKIFRARWVEAFEKLPPPPPDMSCNCCPNIQQNDELLRLILKRIGTPVAVQIFDEDLEREGSQKATKNPDTLFKASKLGIERTEISNRLIGIENYPVKVPETMIEPHKEGIFESIFGFFEGEKQREIKSITELVTWMAEQDSAVLGQFHQVIEFEQDFDGDGKIQKEQVVLPNIAESLKEVILLLVQLANNEGTKVHALAKILIEISNIKTNLFKTMNTVVDIQDYLDYPTFTKAVDVPLPVDLTLDKELGDFVNFFKESTGKTTFEDWDGTNSLHDNMMDLMQMATMLRAMLYQRTNQE